MMRLESAATRPVVIGLWCGGATDKLLLHLAGPDTPGHKTDCRQSNGRQLPLWPVKVRARRGNGGWGRRVRCTGD